jgi:Ca2+-binding EF-hand superfamily protein
MLRAKQVFAAGILLGMMVAWALGQRPEGGPGMFPGGPPGMFPGGPGMFPGGPPGMFPGGPGVPPSDWERFRGGRRWGGSDGPPGGRFEDRAQRFEAFLRQFDANGDGMISPNEVNSSRRPFYEGLVRRAGMDPNSTISIQALREALSQRRSSSSGSSGPSEGGGKPGGDASKPAPSLVPGFGTGSQGATVPGFGIAPPAKPSTPSGSGPASSSSPLLASNSPGPSPSSPPPAPSPSPAPPSSQSGASPASPSPPVDSRGVDERVRRYAEALLRQYDKNKNNVLEKDEWSQMQSRWHDADANRDGVITLDELAARMSNFSRSRSSPPSSSSGTMVSSGPSVGGNSAPRKSIRFLSPQERLPPGLPDWFLRKDADGDGQVSMAEYARSDWSDSLAEEFNKYDLNGDGIITPEECLKASSKK